MLESQMKHPNLEIFFKHLTYHFQENKNFMLKKIYLFIFFIILVAIVSCDYFEEQKTRESSIGIYDIDLTKSRILLKAKDSIFFKDLSFILTEDSFKFSKNVPFKYDSFGTWETETVDAAVYIDLKYSNRGFWQIGPGKDYIDMPYRYTIEKYPEKKAGMLHFVKRGTVVYCPESSF